MSAPSLDRHKISFVLLEGIHESAVETLARAGYTNVVRYPGALEGAALAKAVSKAHFLGIRSRSRMTAEVLAGAGRLNAIGCFCIGTNQVDLEAARGAGIPVFNAPFSNTRSVAELVVGEIILLMRGIFEKNAALHRGQWRKSARDSFEVRGKLLGIVGYGHIGTQVGILAEALGMQVLYYDIEKKLSLGNARRAASLEQLLDEADVVTLHLPETPMTRGLFGTSQFECMRPGAVLINTSRGSVVEIDALVASLRSGRLRGAALDVFPQEPQSAQEEFLSPLRDFDNVLLTPHVGGSTLEAQRNIGAEVAEKLLRYSDNGSTIAAVNFPQVALPELAGKHRLLHIHRNIPGIMARVNGVFSDRRINIAGQALQTDSEIGYVVIDIDQEHSQTALRLLKQIPGTLRCRVLH